MPPVDGNPLILLMYHEKQPLLVDWAVESVLVILGGGPLGDDEPFDLAQHLLGRQYDGAAR
jgi:hypothetical protein